MSQLLLCNKIVFPELPIMHVVLGHDLTFHICVLNASHSTQSINREGKSGMDKSSELTGVKRVKYKNEK